MRQTAFQSCAVRTARVAGPRVWFAFGLILLVLSAAALTISSVVTPASAATCAGSGCSGLDPFQTGCANDQSVAGSAPIVDGAGRRIGTLNLYFSSVCQSNWVSASFNDGNPPSTPPVNVTVVGSQRSG